MKSYLSSAVSKKQTPQSEPIPGSSQTENSAGGYSWQVDKWTQLERFLILGAEGGTYYIKERKLVQDNAKSVIACIKEDGIKAVSIITAISHAGRAPKNDPALFALALAMTHGDVKTRQEAAIQLPRVARTGTHLFHFVEFANEMRGWGSVLKSAVADWYLSKDTDKLAYQLVKYQQRDGWSHRDLLRLSKPVPLNEKQSNSFKWAVGKGLNYPTPTMIGIFEEAKTASEKDTVNLILNHSLPRECVNTAYLKSPKIWEALLENMPLTAMIRNLGNMTAVGLITPNSDAAIKVYKTLNDQNLLKKARIHPLNVYLALYTYKAGHGLKGGNTWNPVTTVSVALEEAFYESFDYVKPTNKRWMLGLDVSGSMGSAFTGLPLTCRDASALLAMVTLRTEPFCFVGGFTNGSYPSQWSSRGYNSGFTPLNLTPKQSLQEAIKTVSGIPFGGTDCALPMIYATENKIPVDCFIVYTDNETWAGKIHPKQALDQYRQKTGIAAKSIVVGMEANPFTIADPNDSGMMDVVGMDISVPTVMSSFVGGEGNEQEEE